MRAKNKESRGSPRRTAKPAEDGVPSEVEEWLGAIAELLPMLPVMCALTSASRYSRLIVEGL